MIGAGTVGLYLEKSEDKQMQIAKEFGDFRQKEFPGGDDDLARWSRTLTRTRTLTLVLNLTLAPILPPSRLGWGTT